MARSPRPALKAFTERVVVGGRGHAQDVAKAALIRTATEVRDRTIKEQTARAGIAPTYQVYVDGKEGAPLSAVKHDGMILFEWDYVREIASEAVRLLRDAGPEMKGDWKRGISVFADNAEVDPTAIPNGAKLVEILPTVVYARYLERVENFSAKGFGLVAHIAIDLGKLYHNVARVRFSYTTFEGGGEDMAVKPRKGKPAEPMRYPAIIVRSRA